MATQPSRRSSVESDYTELYEAVIRDRVRDNIATYAPQKHHRTLRGNQEKAAHDDELKRMATNLTKDVGLVPARLGTIDARLDPHSDEFDFRFWASTFLQMMREDGITRANANLTFKSLCVTGISSGAAIQPTVASLLRGLAMLPMLCMHRRKKEAVTILHPMNGFIDKGEMLLVLGRPGSGCSTFLRSISGHMNGLKAAQNSSVTYDGIKQADFLRNFRGRAVYNEDSEDNFPHLTVAQTLEFAAHAQTPQTRIEGVDRTMYAKHMIEVMLRIFGLSHARDTIVGDATIRGVSGGERKRVSIAEMAFTRSSLATWDNSTRGLDSAMSLEFVRHLRTLSDLVGVTQAVAIYQASQAMYDLFDKVMVLYEGRQIYYGPVVSARQYFQNMGWACPPRQTTPDFLTSVTNPSERHPVEGFVGSLPHTPLEFEQYWLRSEQCKAELALVEKAQASADPDAHLAAVRAAHRQAQAHHTRDQSAYIISIPMQVRLCIRRTTQLLSNDRGSTVALAVMRVILALIIGSIYFDPPNTTDSLQSRGSVIFLATLMNALMAVNEVSTLFSKRLIVLKQKNYGFCHPSADALAAYVVSIPINFAIATLFNVVLYFMAGLRAEASNFFIFLLFNFISVLMMSAIFRTIGAACKQMTQAFAICGIFILILVIYTGFAIQTDYMHPWFRWLNYLNPMAYIFEALLVNEVHGRQIPCAPSSIIPSYGVGANFACSVVGAQPEQTSVSGDAWVQASYGYSYSHIWRNLGIALGYLVFFLATYLLAIEFKSSSDVQAQRLVYRNRQVARESLRNQHDIEAEGRQDPQIRMRATSPNEKSSETDSHSHSLKTPAVVEQEKTAIAGGTLTWEDLCLEIEYQGSTRRLLDNVTGCVTPQTLTCLMGSSGAGKTTLLDTLAQRQTGRGNVTGSIKMNGAALSTSFQRQIGYVQQQDIHLATTTVREALQFSALLRQPATVSKAEKLAYVETVIDMLGMSTFSDCMVGHPGEGLNIEQRKLLTIGVELASKPAVLYLDEPTSGLDSQSSWTIVSFLRKLADNGQAILTTIHQPSALILEQFDSILLLGKGGKTNYFGPIGQDARTLTGYFERNGARSCGVDENPAEYILSVATDPSKDWPRTWTNSQELRDAKSSIHNMPTKQPPSSDHTTDENRKYATSFTTQLTLQLRRTFQNYWRSPLYIMAKVQFALLSSLFIGFTFYLQNSSIQGMQNLILAIYMLNITFSTIVNQVTSRFLSHRSLFEVRESPSRMFSWVAFCLSHIVVEIPYQVFTSVIIFACWYYPIFGTSQPGSNQGLMFGFIVQFTLMAASWGQMLIFTLPSTETAGALSNILFTLTLQFNGVLQPPNALPGFWIFMYRLSPFTYLVGGLSGTGLEDRPVICATNELAVFNPPQGRDCGTYMAPYLEGGAPGQLLNPDATAACQYCPLTNANQFLARSWIEPANNGRNLGLLFVYIAFNMAVAMGMYYVFRVRRFSLRRAIMGWKKTGKRVEAGETAREKKQGKSLRKKVGFYVGLYWALAVAVLRRNGGEGAGFT